MKYFEFLLPLFAMLLAGGRSAFAESPRAIHPELVGVTTVSLNLSVQNLPGLNAEALERDIRNELHKGGVRIEHTAPVTLYVRITYQQIPACTDFIAFRVYVALSEDVVVHRGKRAETVYVDTWHDSEDSVEPTSTAGKAAQESVLGLLTSFINTAQYTAEVMRDRCQTRSKRMH